nr:hypothetical protein [Tanacetum cinerariifolium]
MKCDRSKSWNETDLDRITCHRSRSRTMDTTIDQQVAMDEALVPTAQRLRIGRSNFRLLSSTLQLATTNVHHHAIRFKMDNKKHIVYLESFRDILHICPRVHGQAFDEPPFKEEILAFIRFLGHNAPIRTLTDVNINKLYHLWRSFAAIINKCLTGKSSGYDSLRLSQAQILWGLYHKRNVDYTYLMWENFVYHVEHKNQKKSNEMYYPRFTKAIIHHFMSKDPLIPRRNKPKASFRRTRSSSDTSITPPTATASPRLIASAKGKQPAKAFEAKSLSALSEPSGSGADKGTEEELSWNSTNDEDDDNEEKDDDGDDGDADQEVVRDDDKDDEEEGGDEEHEFDEETRDEESFDQEEEDELYRDVNINQGRVIQATLEVEDSYVTLTSVNPDGQQESSQTNQFAGAVSSIPRIVNHYMDQRMNEAVKVVVQIQSDRLRDETQRENDEFLRTVDEKIKKIIKEQ